MKVIARQSKWRPFLFGSGSTWGSVFPRSKRDTFLFFSTRRAYILKANRKRRVWYGASRPLASVKRTGETERKEQGPNFPVASLEAFPSGAINGDGNETERCGSDQMICKTNSGGSAVGREVSDFGFGKNFPVLGNRGPSPLRFPFAAVKVFGILLFLENPSKLSFHVPGRRTRRICKLNIFRSRFSRDNGRDSGPPPARESAPSAFSASFRRCATFLR